MADKFAQKYTITDPQTQASEIDDMFHDLYSRLSDSVVGSGLTDVFDDGDLVYVDDDAFDGLAIGTSGKVIRSNGTLPVYSTFTISDTFASGSLLHASAADTVTALTIGSAGQVVRSTGTFPAYSTFTIPDTFASGALVYASSSNVLAALAISTAGKIVRSTGSLPAYSTFTIADSYGPGAILHATAADVVAGLAVGAVDTLLRSTGSLPTYTAFTIPNAFAQGDVIFGLASNVLTALAKDANATRYLSNTGASNNPAWAQIALATGVSGDLPFANLTQIAGLSVLGVTGDVLADVAAITAGTDHQVLRRSGTAVAFGAVNLASSAAVTGDLPYANFVQASAASKLVGRGSAGGAGDFEEITLGSGLTMTATTLSVSATTNALLDAGNHTDTVAQAVTRGSLIYGNATPKWDELVIGAANRVLGSDGTDAAWVQADHGLALTGLTDDDHTQYALLAGRSGGQSLIGGTASGNGLTFQTTSHATKGSYTFTDGIIALNASSAAANQALAIDTTNMAAGSNSLRIFSSAVNRVVIADVGTITITPLTSGATQAVQVVGTNLTNGSNVFFADMPLGWTGNIFKSNLNSVEQWAIAQEGTAYFSNLGIGKASPATRLDILAADNTTAVTIGINATQANITGADKYVSFTSTTGEEANVIGTGVLGVIAYNTFTGSHKTRVKKPVKILQLLEMTGTLICKREFTQGCSPKEFLPHTRVCRTKNSKACYGVYAGPDDSGMDMALALGTGWILVANTGKNLRAGDRLMSSDVPGHAELAYIDGHVIASLSQDVNWKKGEKLRKSACRYLMG